VGLLIQNDAQLLIENSVDESCALLCSQVEVTA